MRCGFQICSCVELRRMENGRFSVLTRRKVWKIATERRLKNCMRNTSKREKQEG